MSVPQDSAAVEPQPAATRSFSAVTWNMDHWKRTAQQRRDAWSYLLGLGCDVALLQECVAPGELDRVAHRAPPDWWK